MIRGKFLDTSKGAPKGTKFRAVDPDGRAYFFTHCPVWNPISKVWVPTAGEYWLDEPDRAEETLQCFDVEASYH